MPAPTCFVCGHILSEFEWSSELNFFVHSCPECKQREEGRRLKEVHAEIAESEVMKKAA